MSSQSSHHPQEVLLTQFSLYVHKGGLKPDSFHFITDPASTISVTSAAFAIMQRRSRILDHTTKTIAVKLIGSRLDYCISLVYDLIIFLTGALLKITAMYRIVWPGCK